MPIGWWYEPFPRPTTLVFSLTVAVASLCGGLPAARAGGRNLEGVVNLNTASADLLVLLPGVGPSKARGIVVYRARHSFRTVDELVRIKGIGRRMVRQMREHLAVTGPSTARALVGAPVAAIPPPRPPPPVQLRGRPLCRPGVAFSRPAPPGGGRPPPRSMGRSAANHCRPPA